VGFARYAPTGGGLNATGSATKGVTLLLREGANTSIASRIVWGACLFALARLGSAHEPGEPAQLIGTWRGTSICTDRVAAPACHDETVVYEFAAGPQPGTVRWKADKVVNGKRQPMGEMSLTYDKAEACWKGEFESPRVHSVWCLAVTDDRISGTGRLLPGQQTIRRIDVRKDPQHP
jgi:hypothetical protein